MHAYICTLSGADVWKSSGSPSDIYRPRYIALSMPRLDLRAIAVGGTGIERERETAESGMHREEGLLATHSLQTTRHHALVKQCDG